MSKSLLFGSVTDICSEHAGAVVVVGSHGGRATGRYALLHRLRGLICHDAGIGLGGAGVEAMEILSAASTPGASVDFQSARIGDAADMMARGRISRVNDVAHAAGVELGDRVEHALGILTRLPSLSEIRDRHSGTQMLAADIFKRHDLRTPSGRPLVMLDSASSILPSDDNAIVITGSHGGLPGGSGVRAIKTRPYIAIFNDAGVGIDAAGISRLPVLDDLNIAAACVDTNSARIGDGRSTYETGVISFVNETARALGLSVGASIRETVGKFAGGLISEPSHDPTEREHPQ